MYVKQCGLALGTTILYPKDRLVLLRQYEFFFKNKPAYCVYLSYSCDQSSNSNSSLNLSLKIAKTASRISSLSTLTYTSSSSVSPS